jgi:Rad3-related DNA helicase
MNYRVRVRRFGDRAKNLPCEATTESEAREEYHDMRESLAAQQGGYIGLFEAYKKAPLLAERVGQEPAPALEKEAAATNKPGGHAMKERVQTR